MPEEQQKQDYRNRNSKEPEQDSATHDRTLDKCQQWSAEGMHGCVLSSGSSAAVPFRIWLRGPQRLRGCVCSNQCVESAVVRDVVSGQELLS